MPSFILLLTAFRKRKTRLLPAAAVTGLLGASLVLGPAAIVGFTGYDYGGPPCFAAALSASPAQPQAPGPTVTLTASAANCTNPEFEFYVQPPGGAWTAQTGWLPWPQNTYSWNTTGLVAGIWGIGVWARHSGSTGSFESYYLGTYQLNIGNCRTASIAPSSLAPQAPGTDIAFTADSCPGASYRWFGLPPGGSWVMLQDYGSDTFDWTAAETAASPQGTYQIGVWARQQGSGAAYDAYAIITFQLVGSVCGSVSLSASPASGQPNGTPVTFTATSTGCPSAQYEFWEQAPGGTWTIDQAYGPPSFADPAVNGVGAHYFGVWVRATGSTNAFDAYTTITYWIGP